MTCPNCGSRVVGKIGNRQFYCWNCYVEFTQRSNGYAVYEVDAEGVLVPQGAQVAQWASSSVPADGPGARPLFDDRDSLL